jgi:hypothetical protein
MKHSYQDDPGLSDRVFDLLDLVFPGLRRTAHNASALGAPWQSASTPRQSGASRPIASDSTPSRPRKSSITTAPRT